MHTTKWKESQNEKLFFMNIILKQADNHPYPAEDAHMPIRFSCRAPGAKSVALVGDFNLWHPFVMQRSVEFWWHAEVELRHGHYQYRFLVDGQPTLDTAANGVGRDERGEMVSLLAVS